MEYKKQLVTFKLRTVENLSPALFLIAFTLGVCVNIPVMRRPLLLTDAVWWDMLITLGVYVVGLFLHEGLHAAGGLLCGCKPKDIRFGVIVKQMMLYCHIEKPMSVKVYRFVLILPFLLTGVVPLLLSIFFGNIFLIVAFSALIAGCSGDLVMLASLSGLKGKQLIADHPEAPAYYLVYPENSLPEDFVEATPEREEELKRAMSAKPGERLGRGKNTGVRVLLVLLFLAIVVTVVFLFSLLMKLY